MKDVHNNTLLKISTEVIIRQCHLWGHECDTLKMIALLSDTEFIIQLLKTRGFSFTRRDSAVTFVKRNTLPCIQRRVIHKAWSLKRTGCKMIYENTVDTGLTH